MLAYKKGALLSPYFSTYHEDRNFHFHFGLRHGLIDVIVQCHVQEGDLAEKLALISPTCHD